MYRLSIIVPIYNVENYLGRCLDSLLAQMTDTYEIILVDDGATDHSGVIAEEYAKNNADMQVIHQKNKGLSGARNTGLKAALGDYVVFVDSDDWINSDALHEILIKAESDKLDIGTADFQFVDENGIKKRSLEPPFHTQEVLTGSEYFKQSLMQGMAMMVWKNIYRRLFLLENELFFREGYNHEDEEWMPRAYLNAKRVADISVVYYNYFVHTNCISKDPSRFEKNSLDLISNCWELKKISKNIADEELKHLFQNRIVYLYLSAFYKGKLTGRRYTDKVNKLFFEDMYYEGKNISKVKLFKISKTLYYNINYLMKCLEKRND